MTSVALATLLSLAAATGTGTADDLLRDTAGVVAGGLTSVHHTATSWNPDAIHYTFVTRDSPEPTPAPTLVVTLTRREASEPSEHGLTRYDLAARLEPSGSQTVLKTPIAEIVARIRSNEAHGPELRRVRGAGPEPARDPAAADPAAGNGGPRGPPVRAHREIAGAEQTADLELWICFALLGLFILLFPWLAGEAWRQVFAGSRREVLISAVVFLGVAAVQLFAVPQLLVTVFSGYASVAEAEALRPVVKYGAATTALYGPLIRLFGASTDVITAANVLLGLLTLPLAGALARRLTGDRLAPLLAMIVVGLAPALLRDRASESILVPMQLWLLAAAVHAGAWLDTKRAIHLVGVVVSGALALNARPEAAFALPVLLAALVAVDDGWQRARVGWRPVLIAAGVTAALAIPRLLSLLSFMGAAAEAGDVPGLAAGGVGAITSRFVAMNALWMPELFNIALTILAFGGLLLAPRGRRLAWGLMLLCVLGWQALSTFDLPPVSIPRVQAPALLWTALLAAGPLALGFRQRSQPVLILAALTLVAATVPQPDIVRTLWAPTNAQSFDRWWHDAIDELPESTERRCVIALAMSDQPRDIVLRHYPLYEVAARSGGLESYAITTFLEAPTAVTSSGCEALYLEGPQCWASFFGFDAERPAEAKEHTACRIMRERFILQPLASAELPNAGNADFPFYGASDTLRYGLYRIRGRMLQLRTR